MQRGWWASGEGSSMVVVVVAEGCDCSFPSRMIRPGIRRNIEAL